MTAILWGQTDRLLEYGVDHGVVYISGSGTPWEGITSVDEVVSDGVVSSYYFDGVKTIDVVGGEDFALHVTAYFCPEEFENSRLPFGFSYRTQDSSGTFIHLVYNAIAKHSDKSRQTKSDKVNPTDFAWDISTVPVDIPGAKPTAHLMINVNDAYPDALAELEDIIYGSEDTDPRLPSSDEVIELFGGHATLIIINHGDGTWTAIGPDDVVYMLDDTTFAIDWPSVIYLTSDTYNVSSL